MAIYNIDSSSVSNLVVSKSFIATSSIQFVTNSLYINNGLGQGRGVNFNLIVTSSISGSHAEGLNNKASGYWSHAEGVQTTASNGPGHTEGYNNFLDVKGHMEGFNNTGSYQGEHAHTEGEANFNGRVGTHVEGYNNSPGSHALANSSAHVEGYNNKIVYPRSFQYYFHFEGEGNRGPLDGNGTFRVAHVEGYGNQFAFGSQYSNHLEGSGSYTPATPVGESFGGYDGTHIEGGGHNLYFSASVPGAYAKFCHVEGFNNSIKPYATQSAPNSTFVSNWGSHIEGANNVLSNSDGSSWVTGIDNIMYPPISSSGFPVTRSAFQVQAIGRGLRAYNTASIYAMFLGHYNTSLLTGSNYIPANDGYIVVGGGTSNSNRANIIEIYQTTSSLSSFMILPGIQSFNGNQSALDGGVPIGGLYASGGILSIVTGSS